MTWALYAVLASFFVAIRSDVNRRYKQDGFRLNFWRSITMVVLTSPVVIYYGWPELPEEFYLIAIITGAYSSVAMTIKLNLAARKNGRVANMEAPVKVFAGFVMWLIADAAYRDNLFSDIPQFVGVIAMFLLAAFCLGGLRQNDTGWRLFLLVSPIGVISAGLDVFIKRVFDQMVEINIMQLSACLVFMIFAVASVLSGVVIIARRSPDRPIFTKPLLEAGFWTGFYTTLNLFCFYIALSMVENPAYISAITMLSAVWLLLFHRIKGIPDDASPLMGTLLVISSIGLVLITR